MATANSLVSAAVTAALLVGTAVFVVYGRPWRHYSVNRVTDRSSHGTDRTTLWLAGFLALVVFAAVATVVTLDSGDIGPLVVFVGGAVLAFLTYGVYVFGRSHGHPRSHAVGEAVITLGGVGLVAVVVRLVL